MNTASAAPDIPAGPLLRRARVTLGVPSTIRPDGIELLLLALLTLLGLVLNHSSVILDLNLSLADPVVAILAILLLATRRLWIPTTPLVFFLVLSVQLIAVTTLLVPVWTHTPLPLADFAQEYAKLTVSFLCLLLGVQAVRMGYAQVLLRAFVAGSVAVSCLAMVPLVLPGLPGLDSLFLGGFRFQGLTNDPNNFAVMTIAALAVLWYDPKIRMHLRLAASVILVSGVLLSASKTGAITLAALVIWRALGLRTSRSADAGSRSRRLLTVLFMVALAVTVLLVAPATGIGGSLGDVVSRVPALERTSVLFTSFDNAIVGSGSERESAWSTALALILFSPAVGVGVGTYLPVAQQITGDPVLAHNTYLQIMAEWGLPLALVFLAWTARSTLLRPTGTRHHALWATSSTALLVMLVGSIGLSLNNSRLLWVLLGITLATHLMSRNDHPAHGAHDAPSPTRIP